MGLNAWRFNANAHKRGLVAQPVKKKHFTGSLRWPKPFERGPVFLPTPPKKQQIRSLGTG